MADAWIARTIEYYQTENASPLRLATLAAMVQFGETLQLMGRHEAVDTLHLIVEDEERDKDSEADESAFDDTPDARAETPDMERIQELDRVGRAFMDMLHTQSIIVPWANIANDWKTHTWAPFAARYLNLPPDAPDWQRQLRDDALNGMSVSAINARASTYLNMAWPADEALPANETYRPFFYTFYTFLFIRDMYATPMRMVFNACRAFPRAPKQRGKDGNKLPLIEEEELWTPNGTLNMDTFPFYVQEHTTPESAKAMMHFNPYAITLELWDRMGKFIRQKVVLAANVPIPYKVRAPDLLEWDRHAYVLERSRVLGTQLFQWIHQMSAFLKNVGLGRMTNTDGVQLRATFLIHAASPTVARPLVRFDVDFEVGQFHQLSKYLNPPHYFAKISEQPNLNQPEKTTMEYDISKDKQFVATRVNVSIDNEYCIQTGIFSPAYAQHLKGAIDSLAKMNIVYPKFLGNRDVPSFFHPIGVLYRKKNVPLLYTLNQGTGNILSIRPQGVRLKGEITIPRNKFRAEYLMHAMLSPENIDPDEEIDESEDDAESSSSELMSVDDAQMIDADEHRNEAIEEKEGVDMIVDEDEEEKQDGVSAEDADMKDALDEEQELIEEGDVRLVGIVPLYGNVLFALLYPLLAADPHISLTFYIAQTTKLQQELAAANRIPNEKLLYLTDGSMPSSRDDPLLDFASIGSKHLLYKQVHGDNAHLPLTPYITSTPRGDIEHDTITNWRRAKYQTTPPPPGTDTRLARARLLAESRSYPFINDKHYDSPDMIPAVDWTLGAS